jgi:hypothetical protein
MRMSNFFRKTKAAMLRKASSREASLPMSSIRSRMEIERDRQNFRILPKGDGYRERDATKSTLDPARACVDVTMRREHIRELMHEREIEIGLGLEHLTPAAEEIKHKRGSP